MTAIGLPPRRLVHVGVQSSTGIAVGTNEQQLALAGEVDAKHALSVADQERRAVALQQQAPFGMAFQRQALFTAVGGRQGPQGIRGVPGPDGGSALQRIAGETLSALRAVYELNGQVFYLDYRDSAHIDLLLGITLTAADMSATVDLQRSSFIDDSGWSWTPGRVWLGVDGALTQTPPADGYDVLIGAAVSATRITLNITDPIELE